MAQKQRRRRRAAAPAGQQYTGSEAIVAAAQRWNVPVWILAGVKLAETGSEPSLATTSSAGASGPFGFMPATAAEYGVNTGDFASSADGAAHLLSDFYKQFGSWDLALEAYNAGPANAGKGIGYDTSWIEHKLREFGLSKAKIQRAEHSQFVGLGLDGLKSTLDKAFGWALGGVLRGKKAGEAIEEGDVGKLGGALVGDPLKAVGDFFSILTSGETWLRLVEVLAGAILFYLGLKTLTGTGASDLPGAGAVKRIAPV